MNGSTNLSSFTTSLSQPGTGITFTPATGALSGISSTAGLLRVRITGLTYGLHTISVTDNGGQNGVLADCLDIITPIHFPNTKTGSLSMGPGVEVKQAKEESNVDLSKAKAWVRFDLAASTILGAHNISAVLNLGSGNMNVYLQKPFKSNNYLTLTGAEELVSAQATGNTVRNKTTSSFQIQSFETGGPAGNTKVINVACFGELEEEGE
jgi:hypothetical protein